MFSRARGRVPWRAARCDGNQATTGICSVPRSRVVRCRPHRVGGLTASGPRPLMGLNPRPHLRLPLDTRRMARALRQMPMLRPLRCEASSPVGSEEPAIFQDDVRRQTWQTFPPCATSQTTASESTESDPNTATLRHNATESPDGSGSRNGSKSPSVCKRSSLAAGWETCVPNDESWRPVSETSESCYADVELRKRWISTLRQKGFETSQAATAGKQCELRAAGSEAGQARTCGSCAKHL